MKTGETAVEIEFWRVQLVGNDRTKQVDMSDFSQKTAQIQLLFVSLG